MSYMPLDKRITMYYHVLHYEKRDTILGTCNEYMSPKPLKIAERWISMENEPVEAKKIESARNAAERIEKMIEDGKLLIEEAHRQARELRRRIHEERKVERQERRSERLNRSEPKKEKILNLRIDRDLEDKIRSEAKRINVPISNLVRNILEDTFTLVDGIGENVETMVRNVVGNAGNVAGTFKTAVKDFVTVEDRDSAASGTVVEKTPKDFIEDVSAWQEVTAGKAASCASCSGEINRGDKAHLGVADTTGKKLFLCGACIGSVGKMN